MMAGDGLDSTNGNRVDTSKAIHVRPIADVATAVFQSDEPRFRALLEAAPDAMLMCHTDGEIVMVNSQTEVLFGVTREKLLAKNIRTLVPDWTSQSARGVELMAIRDGGVPFPVEISFSPLDTEEGVVITSAIRDITERKKADEQIRRLNANLEERVLERTEELLRSNEELQQFAYIASHDLQEPLRTVSIYAQLLAKRYQGQLVGDADKFIALIVENAGRMERLIHDLLDFSRMDARGADYFSQTSCEDALDDAVHNLRPLVDESHAAITRDPLPVVAGDAVQLSRLFQNLLANAIRYRGEDAPRVHISAQARDGEWLVSVKDNGIGVEPLYAEKIFGIFRVLQPRDQTSGSGMGLAICRKIVTRHEGRIWVESELAKGATFYFTLPRKSVQKISRSF